MTFTEQKQQDLSSRLFWYTAEGKPLPHMTIQAAQDHENRTGIKPYYETWPKFALWPIDELVKQYPQTLSLL